MRKVVAVPVFQLQSIVTEELKTLDGKSGSQGGFALTGCSNERDCEIVDSHRTGMQYQFSLPAYGQGLYLVQAEMFQSGQRNAWSRDGMNFVSIAGYAEISQINEADQVSGVAMVEACPD